MAQVDVTYSDNHTIDVDSNKKIKEVTLSGKYEDGYNYKQDLTNNLPFTFNPKSLGLLKNSIFNLDIQIGGEEMRTWLLQPISQIARYGGDSESLPADGTATYTISSDYLSGVSSFFDYLSSDSKTIINNMENACGCDILTTAVLTSAPDHSMSEGSEDTFCGEKCGFIVGSSGLHESITVHATNVTKSGTKYFFSPDITTDGFSTVYFAATNLTSTEISYPRWHIMVAYYATPMSEFPDGYATTTWGTFT